MISIQSILPSSPSLPSSPVHGKSRPSPAPLSSKTKPLSSPLTSCNVSKTHFPQPIVPLSGADPNPYSSLIQSCIDDQFFDAGKTIHRQMLSMGFCPDTYLQTKILMLYARSGDRGDMVIARRLFDEMPVRNSTAWNTMILAYSRESDHEEVVRLFSRMLTDGVPLGKFTFPSVIKGFIAQENKEAFSQVQSLVIKVGLNTHLVVGGALVDGFAGFGWMDEAVAAFEEIDGENLITTWNAILGGYIKLSMWEETWGAFHRMLSVGIAPDHFTFATVIRACGAMSSVEKGKQLHASLIVSGYESDVFVMNSLIDMYASCGDGDSCRMIFELMKDTNQVSWNSIISASVRLRYYEESLLLFLRMQDLGHECDRFNLGSILAACAALAEVEIGKQLHGYLVRRYLDTDLILGTTVIDMYSKCGFVEAAHHVFRKLEARNVVSWNALISGYVQEGQAEETIELFHEMRISNAPDQFTLAILLMLAANQGNELLGKQTHAYMIRAGTKLNIIVETELVHMYNKCGRLREAECIFNSMQGKNNYSWNSMIEGHEQNGNFMHALCLFCQMQLSGVKPDCFSLASVLSACIGLTDMKKGKQIHSFMIRNKSEDQTLCCMLVDMYAKCETMSYAYKVYENARVQDVFLHNMMISALLDSGRINEARKLFDEMEEKNIFSWNMMLMGYSKGDYRNEALRIFIRMAEEGVAYESLTMVPLFNLCASLPALELGKMIQTIVFKRGFSYYNVVLDSAIVDMYWKCGSLEDARSHFNHMNDRNIVTWNSMINAYGKHGESNEVFELYDQMKKVSIKPNGITFLSLFSACSHNGLVVEGLNCFISMVLDHGIVPYAEHYTCMVDLLGRAGFLEEAIELIDKMPLEAEVSTWGALLGACRIHNEIEIGRFAAEKLFELDPENSGHYILMANIYSSVGMLEAADKIRESMHSRGVKKEPGLSWIEVGSEVHKFHAGDRSHPLAWEIYNILRDLTTEMKKMGYIPDNNFVLRDVDDSEECLLQHSERLAVCLGLIKLHEKSVIRIFKNLRICGDCHIAIKLISKITCRTIIVRDINRFHHFKNGICSCGDYW